MSRTDTHSPSNFDPAEYTYAGFVDCHHEEGFEDIEDDRARQLPYWRDSVYGRYHGCDHCGHRGVRYIALFIHEPSQQVIATGTQCATKLALASRDQLDAKKKREEYERRIKFEAWLAASPDNARLMAALDERLAAKAPRSNSFLSDLGFKARRYGSLSERQVEAGLAAIEREAKWDTEAAERKAAEPQPEGPLAEGRLEMNGTILSVKLKESDFGDSWKMLVLLDDGNKVWGTVPETLFVQMEEQTGQMHKDSFKGATVSFTATVTRSNDDEHFGFFKRPAKATLKAAEDLVPEVSNG